MRLGCAHALDRTGLAGDPASAVHRLDPRAKVVGLLGVTVVAVSAPLAAWPAYAACLASLAAVAAVARVGPATLWQRARVVLPLVLAAGATVPFVRAGGDAWSLGPLTVHEAGLATFAAAAAKATIGTLSAVLLGATTPFPAVLRALGALRVPRLLVLIAGISYRYLFVLADELRRMRAALAARGYRPRSALRAGDLGRLASALFLRAHARGERVHLAMRARGYAGTLPVLTPLALRRVDAAFLAAVPGVPLLLRLVLGVAG